MAPEMFSHCGPVDIYYYSYLVQGVSGLVWTYGLDIMMQLLITPHHATRYNYMSYLKAPYDSIYRKLSIQNE